MTFVTAIILVAAYLLIATSTWTKMNKAAVAVFAGTVGWVIAVIYGGQVDDAAHDIFLRHVGRASEIVLFLLATMTIVEILNNNGCFDFFRQLLKTRSARRFLWTLTAITFLLSANLDNLTTTVMMLTLMHDIVESRRQRMVLGAAVVVAANCGGVLTVIGDPAQLLIWSKGAITATNYTLSLLAPCLLAWAVPTWLLARMLPETIDAKWITMPYRGDDTNLKVWQRLVMLIVGIGGLWFIPTFHNLTGLSPFLGALCVLAVLWIVNELMNRRLMDVDKMIERRIPRQLQYGTIQMMLFLLGVLLLISVAQESGLTAELRQWTNLHIDNVWVIGLLTGAVSTVLDNFASAASAFTLYPVADAGPMGLNGIYWKVVAYCSAVGGNLLMVGSLAGMAYLKMEHVKLSWVVTRVFPKALLGALLGLVMLIIQ